MRGKRSGAETRGRESGRTVLGKALRLRSRRGGEGWESRRKAEGSKLALLSHKPQSSLWQALSLETAFNEGLRFGTQRLLTKASFLQSLLFAEYFDEGFPSTLKLEG